MASSTPVLLFLHFDFSGRPTLDDRQHRRGLAGAPGAFAVVDPRWSPRSARGSGRCGPGGPPLARAVGRRGVFLLDEDLLACPSMSSVRSRALMPRSSRSVAPHRIAMSSEQSPCERSPSRRLDGGDLETAAQLVHDQGARVRPRRPRHDQQRLADCTTASRTGNLPGGPRAFFSNSRM